MFQKAKKSIIVISPYVDNTVKHLLSSKHISYNVEKRIVTRVDADTIFDKPYQVRALINSYNIGIEIFHLDSLHSKLLIIDEKEIYLGSQNFTYSGKINKETSVIPSIDFSHTKFMQIIKSNSKSYTFTTCKMISLSVIRVFENK